MLTPAEVAERWCSSYALNFVGHDANFYNAVHDLETLAISQTATIARLRGLIEGMGHARACRSLNFSCRWVCDGCFPGCMFSPDSDHSCNCVKSQVDL